MPWEPPELPEDAEDNIERIFTGLQDRLPGWQPDAGALDTALAEEIATETAQLAAGARAVLEYSIAALGETAFGFPVYTGVAATIDAEVTVTSPGVIIPAGLNVAGVNPAGVEVAFTLLEDVLAGGTTQPVTLVCTEQGDLGNGVPAGPLTLITASSSVLEVEAVAASTNGADGETLEAYLDRLVDWLATLRPGGVRAGDVAALARSVPGVFRARAVDLYDADTDTWDNERTVSVFPIDEDGAPVSGDVAAQVAQVIEEAREVNFIVRIGEPTYTAVNVEYSAIAKTGADPIDVAARINATVLGWLAAFGTTEENEQAWEPVDTVRYLELARVVGTVDGVAYVTSLTLNGITDDLELPGVVPLPASADDPVAPSTCTGTVA